MNFPFFSKKNKNLKKPKEIFYPVCPNCISPHIKPVKEFTSGWLTTPRYYCSNCQYSGPIVLEINIELFEKNSPQEIKKMFLEEEMQITDEIDEDNLD